MEQQPSLLDHIDEKYKAIFAKMLSEDHGKAGMAGLIASRMWASAASVWVANGLQYAALEVIKRELTDGEVAEIEKGIGEVLDGVTCGMDAGHDLIQIQQAFKAMVVRYNADTAENEKLRGAAMREAADKMPLPFLQKMLRSPGTVVVMSGDNIAVSEFMHMSVGFLLQNYIPVNVGEDPDDGGFTAGLKAYKDENDAPFLNFIEKWAAAGKDSGFIKQVAENLETKAPMVFRNIVKLVGSSEDVKANIVHNLLAGGHMSGVSMLVGVPEGVDVARVKKAVYVAVKKVMEVGNDGVTLVPMYYVDGQKCVFSTGAENEQPAQ